MGIPNSRRSNGVGGGIGDGYIHPPPPEHHLPVYRYSSNTGYFSGGGMKAGSMGDTAEVEAGWSIPRPRLREYYGDGFVGG